MILWKSILLEWEKTMKDSVLKRVGLTLCVIGTALCIVGGMFFVKTEGLLREFSQKQKLLVGMEPNYLSLAKTSGQTHLNDIYSEISSDGKSLVVDDLPTNEYEKTVMNYFLPDITNQRDQLADLFLEPSAMGKGYFENMTAENFLGKGSTLRIVITEVNTLEKEQFISEYDTDKIYFEPSAKSKDNLVEELKGKEYVAVKVKYYYFSVIEPVQYDDGERNQTFILVKDDTQIPKIYAISNL